MSQAEAPTTQLELSINCSYFSHDLKESVNRRVFTILVFFQLLLGSAVMGKAFNPIILGLLIAVISAAQAAFKFSDAAAKNRASKIGYSKLRDLIHGNDDDFKIFCDVQERYNDELSREAHISSTYSMIGQQCAYIKLGWKDRVTLTKWHKFIAFFGGTTQIFENKSHQ